jgi:Tfp pilus assembly protein PilE
MLRGVTLLLRILTAAILAVLGAIAAAGAYTEATRVPDQP